MPAQHVALAAFVLYEPVLVAVRLEPARDASPVQPVSAQRLRSIHRAIFARLRRSTQSSRRVVSHYPKSTEQPLPVAGLLPLKLRSCTGAPSARSNHTISRAGP